MLIKIILLLFILFVLVKLGGRLKRQEITGREFAAWLVLWILIGIAVLLPQTTDLLARQVGVGRGLDLALALAVALIFYLVFRIMVKIERIDREITKMVREEALRQAQGKLGKDGTNG